MIDVTKQILPNEWIHFDVELRQKFAAIFNIPKSSSVHVVDNKVESDGYSVQDLTAITVEKMQEFSGSSESDFRKLLATTIEKLTKKEDINNIIIEEVSHEEKPKEIEPTEVQGGTRGRPKKDRKDKEVSSSS